MMPTQIQTTPADQTDYSNAWSQTAEPPDDKYTGPKSQPSGNSPSDIPLSPESDSFIPPPFQRNATFRSIDEDAINGYPKLATYVGGTLPIYRRFATANARILLYRQAEISHLEHELSLTEQKYNSNPRLHHSVRHLMNAQPGTDGYEIWKKFTLLSEAVEKYNRLLLEQNQLYKLPTPASSEVDEVWNYMQSPIDRGESEPWLQPPENSTYYVDDATRKKVQRDLVKLNIRYKEQSPFTKWFSGPFLRWIYYGIIVRIWPQTLNDGWSISDKFLRRGMNMVVIMVGSSLPAISIIALYYIHSAIVRLIFILLFSVVFSACLSIFTQVDRAGIFTANLALAGVQAVFVGSMLANTCTFVVS